jgi:hypothetical protein
MIHSGNIEVDHKISQEELLELGNDKVCHFIISIVRACIVSNLISFDLFFI